jgi:hypothetical protein
MIFEGNVFSIRIEINRLNNTNPKKRKKPSDGTPKTPGMIANKICNYECEKESKKGFKKFADAEFYQCRIFSNVFFRFQGYILA